MTLENAIQKYLSTLSVKKASALTIRNYTHYLHRYLSFVLSKRKKTAPPPELHAITAGSIAAFREYLSSYIDEHGKPLKSITQTYHLIAIRSLLKYVSSQGLDVMPYKTISLPKTKKSPASTIDEDVLTKILAMPDVITPEGLRDKAILELLFASGMRVSELVALDKSVLNSSGGHISVGLSKKRTIPLPETVRIWLGRYISQRTDSSRALFIRYKGKTPQEQDATGESLRLSARGVERLVEKYRKKAHAGSSITPQAFRRSLAQTLLLKKRNLADVQRVLGHKHEVTTERYKISA